MPDLTCPKCGGLAHRNTYFAAYICEKCGERTPMPDLIDREAAVGVLEERRARAYDMLEERRANRISGPRAYETDLSLITREGTLGEAVALLRTFPAVDRRCATCRLWAQHTGPMLPNKGDCKHPVYETVNEEGAYIPLGWIVTPPDHYCAAWKPIPDTNDRSHHTGGGE